MTRSLRCALFALGIVATVASPAPATGQFFGLTHGYCMSDAPYHFSAPFALPSTSAELERIRRQFSEYLIAERGFPRGFAGARCYAESYSIAGVEAKMEQWRRNNPTLRFISTGWTPGGAPPPPPRPDPQAAAAAEQQRRDAEARARDERRRVELEAELRDRASRWSATHDIHCPLRPTATVTCQ